MAPMTRRSNGAGTVFIKHGSYYGRWYTAAGGRANRRLGPVRRPGAAAGLTRAQAEKRLREVMEVVQITTDPDITIAVAGQALLARLEARACAKSHIETVESHLPVHLVPFFGNRPLERIDEDLITRLVVRLRRSGRAPKTVRNLLSTLHSVFELRGNGAGSARTRARSSSCPPTGRARTSASSDRRSSPPYSTSGSRTTIGAFSSGRSTSWLP
jgi:hypothetical protein